MPLEGALSPAPDAVRIVSGEAISVAAGVVTTTAVAGRGLVHSVRLAAQVQYGAAGLQALVALAMPAG